MSGENGFVRGLVGVVIRVTLGATFLWAGYPKVFLEMPVSGQAAADLANLGYGQVQAGANGGGVDGAALASPGFRVVLAQDEAEDAGGADGESAPAEAVEEAGSVAETLLPEVGETDGNGDGDGDASTGGAVYSAGDFEEPVRVKRFYRLILLMHGAATEPLEDGKLRLVPEAVGTNGAMLWWLAFGAALTELVGGALIVLGLFTRLWGLAFVGVMAVAMWLTQIGPALNTGGAFLGFLPDPKYADPGAWTSEGLNTFLFQLTTMGCAVVALFLGGGGLSLDRMLFGKPARQKSASGGGGGA